MGEHCYIWVHNANFDDTSTDDRDNKITSTQAEAMRDAFEAIYPEITNLLGYEIGGGPGGDGGLDGDTRVSILFYDIRNDYSVDQWGGVLGYFWPKDGYTQEQLDGSGYESNEAEIFYIDVHFTDFWPDGIAGTLAHEYQHMIHFAQKDRQGVPTQTWFNEMLSMVTEDFVSETLGTTVYQSHPSGRVGYYNGGYPVSGIVDWHYDAYNLYSYAGAYVFGAFLARNYGGADLIHELLTNSSAGISSINAALSHLGYSERFEDIVEEYSKVHVFPTGHADMDHGFFGTTESFGSETYRLPSFDLFDIGDGDGTYGPIVLDVEQHELPTVRPYGFQTWSAPAWQNLPTDTFTVELERPANASVQLYLMVK
ncbi:MAG: M30 family zinc metallopeptidase [Alkalispirochaeta sp.]